MRRFLPGRLWFMTVLLLAMPFVYLWIASYRSETATPSDDRWWLPTARLALVAMAVGLYAAPFLFERVLTALRARRKDPEQLVLRTAQTCCSMPAFLAFILCMQGGSRSDLYSTVLFALVGITFWSFRYRRLFVSSVKPADIGRNG